MSSKIDPPGLSPQGATEFLRWMKTDIRGLYLLGSLNRHITVHSQQQRAVNLIRALLQVGGDLHGKSIAIVGAGFAGLTAAAFTLKETTAHVTLFDAASRPLWLQDGCANRWLHPGIYDWPLSGSLEPRTALPVLNWHAGTASDVAKHVRAEWERVAATEGLLRLRMETEVKAVTPSYDGRLLVGLSSGEQLPFDTVILAIGFGLERGTAGRVAYWNDADGLDRIAIGSSVLISGFGDGGLADVLRLCLPGIRQNSLVELVRHVPIDRQQELIYIEESCRNDIKKLDQYYSQLRVDEVIQHIKVTEPPLARVTLAGKGSLYSPRSAILNRFLVSQLYQALGEKAFELVKAPVDENSLSELPSGKRRIRFESGEEREFDHVVLRLGPDPSYPRIDPLSDWEVGEERRRFWYYLPQSMDPTRVPLEEVPTVDLPEKDGRSDFLVYESSSRPWCLVLQPPNARVNWAVYARLALEEAAKDIRDLNVHPLILSSKDAFLGPAAIRYAVRALCAANIVIADVTGYDSALLLLLGIRAAVRRSVTIACTQELLNAKGWEGLPFNLKELNLVSFFHEGAAHLELAEALHAGVEQSENSVRYLDLPVYDYIREVPSNNDNVEKDVQQVLLLRAFSEPDRNAYIQARIREGLRLPGKIRVESIIDQTSPRLAGQRLYEAIRHWKTCVVDLTWWRPNVMFELGVRLAVQPSGTFFLIDESAKADTNLQESPAKLKEFLKPFSYNLSTASFSEAFTPPDSDYSLIYETVVRHFRSAQDHYDQSVDDMLVKSADEMRRQDYRDPLQYVDITPLYASDNQVYGEEIRHAAFERLCAAWYYLANREVPYAARPVDLLDPRRLEIFRNFSRLGSRLKAELAQRHEPRDERLRRSIAEAEEYASASGAASMSELLGEWFAFRRAPLWSADLATVEPPWNGWIEDCDHYSQKLSALESRLSSLASPVRELPLQGVRSDLKRLEVFLQQLRRRIS